MNNRLRNDYIAKTYGYDGPCYGFKVAFYEGGEKTFKRGKCADDFARKCARNGKWCELYVLAEDGWKELAAC